MFYTVGFMKCVIAPTLGMAFWAWFVTEAVLFPELGINEAAVAGIFMALPLALGFAGLCHFTRGSFRAFFVVAAVTAIVFFTPELSSKSNPEFTWGDQQVMLPPMMMVIFTGFFGFCFWPVIYPREVLAINGGVIRSVATVTLEDATDKGSSNRERP